MDQLKQPPKLRTIAFDYAGVIADYKGFLGKDYEYTPNREVVQAMNVLQKKGYKILIHSTEGDEFLKQYCQKFSIPFDYINKQPDKETGNPGKPIAFVYVDDRAICYKGQKADELVNEIINFKPYWKEN